MRARTLIAVVLGFLVVAGAAWYVRRAMFSPTLTRHALPVGVVGCWGLFDSNGERAEGSLYWSPSFAKLDSSPNTVAANPGPGTLRRVHRLDSLRRPLDPDSVRPWRPAPDEFNYWSADSLAERLRIRFSAGLSGTRFVFALPPPGSISDTLRGRAVEHWDFPPYRTARGRAYAVRVACSP